MEGRKAGTELRGGGSDDGVEKMRWGVKKGVAMVRHEPGSLSLAAIRITLTFDARHGHNNKLHFRVTLHPRRSPTG